MVENVAWDIVPQKHPEVPQKHPEVSRFPSPMEKQNKKLDEKKRKCSVGCSGAVVARFAVGPFQ